MRVVLVAGARPNFMKVKPVLTALETRGVGTVLVHTGQHYDPAMSDVFFDDLGLRRPDHALGVGSGTHAQQTARVMTRFERLLDGEHCDLVAVVGDVNSTLAAALVAAKAGVLVAHVEAGLRSRDWRMPEEINRVVADRVSDLLFAPSPDAGENLVSEGYRPDQIHVVGNVMVDTLLASLQRAQRGRTLERLGVEPGGYGIVTLHRPENVDDDAVLGPLLATLAELGRELPLLLPAHPRVRPHLEEIRDGSLHVLDPLGYLDFVALEAGARVALTDSGGVQEETTILGVPCLTLRECTERPITLSEGTNVLVGRDPARIADAFARALSGNFEPRRPALWDGLAAERIADVVVAHGAAGTRRRPTDL